MADGGSSRVSIPHNLRETLESIREYTGKQHSDEDILAVYKDSFNDPHETAQKLLFLDTFHEVKSKREKRKENIVPVTQASGRSGRRNFASSNTYQGNGRSASFKRESGAKHVTGGSRTSLPAANKANLTVPSAIKVSGPTSTSLPSEVTNHKVQDDPLLISTSGQQDSPLISATRCTSQSDQVTEIETASVKGSTQSLLKSDVSEGLHVTFPFHLQVDQVFQNGLTFGSFDSNFVKEASSKIGASGGDDSNVDMSHGTEGNEGESSPIADGIPEVASAREEASTFSEDKDSGISNSVPGAELVMHSDHSVPPAEDLLKEEALSNTQTHQIAYRQEAPLSVFGLAPSLSTFGTPVNAEAAETQPAISLASYPPDQFAIAAASQQATHLFRQQYPPNFYPYGPYYSPYYMPTPHIHQLVSPNVISQQSYFPPGTTLAAPSHINPVGNTENPPTTNLSPHPSSTAATALNSIQSEERTSAVTESRAAWIGQGLGNLQVSPMYNLAVQGQPLGFPVVQAGHGGLIGIHQPTQPMAAASTTYQTLPPVPPYTTSAMAEPIGHPHIAYQQPQGAPKNWVNNY